MIAIAKNLGEAPLFYAELVKNDDGSVSFKKDGKFASQQPSGGDPDPKKAYENAYGLFKWVPQNKEWERAEVKGAIVTFSVNGERFGYVAF